MTFRHLRFTIDEACRAGVIAVTAILFGVMVLLAVLLVSHKARAHDIYTSWRQPGTGMSCCSETDCRALSDDEVKFENGHWSAYHRDLGKWLAVPADRIINEPNPTGKAHLCASRAGMVWCFLRPDGGT